MRTSVGTAPIRFRTSAPAERSSRAGTRFAQGQQTVTTSSAVALAGQSGRIRSLPSSIMRDKARTHLQRQKGGTTRPRRWRRWLPPVALPQRYLSFKGAGVLGTPIASANCASAGLTEGVNCTTIAGQGLNIGSPLTTGLGKQDLTYVGNTSPASAVDSRTSPISPTTVPVFRPVAISSNTTDVSMPT